MASVNYILRSNKKGDSDVSVWVSLRSTYFNIKLSTKIKVPFNVWDVKRGKLKPYQDKPIEVIKRLDRASKDLDNK